MLIANTVVSKGIWWEI